jgi:hypothetical protein
VDDVVDDMASRQCNETVETLAIRISALEKQLALQITLVRENIQIALAASDKAVIKAEAANEKRFENVNEFRATLADQQNTLLPRTEYTVQHKALVDRITDLESITREYRGKFSGTTATVSVVAIIITMLISIAAVLVHFRT